MRSLVTEIFSTMECKRDGGTGLLAGLKRRKKLSIRILHGKSLSRATNLNENNFNLLWLPHN